MLLWRDLFSYAAPHRAAYNHTIDCTHGFAYFASYEFALGFSNHATVTKAQPAAIDSAYGAAESLSYKCALAPTFPNSDIGTFFG